MIDDSLRHSCRVMPMIMNKAVYMVEGSEAQCLPKPITVPASIYLSITLAEFGEGLPLQMIFITLVIVGYIIGLT